MSGATDRPEDETPEPAGSAWSLVPGDGVRLAAAGLTLAAAVIHFAFAPAHLDESGAHGAFFLTVGWLQVVAAAGLAFRARPERAWLAGTAVLQLAVIATWVVSRTVGVPGSEAEDVGFPDTLAAVLEALTVVAVVALLADRVPASARSLTASGVAVAAGIPAVALVALVTASVTPAVAGEHAHEGGETAAGQAHGADGESASSAGHSDGAADWDQQRLAALAGYQPEPVVEAFREANRQYLAEQIRERSDVLAALPEAERERRIAEFVDWSVDNALMGENGAATEDEPSMHSHGPSVWQPLTDPAEQIELQRQLQAAGAIIDQFRTAADAMAAGYHQVTPYVPGIGAHYLDIGLIQDGFDPAAPEMLLYNGNDPSSELVGFSYATWGSAPTEGFAGGNDVWHQHRGLCTIGTFVVGPDHTSEEMCESIGGEKGVGGELWMTHLWQVEGWESPWGVFSGENPQINIVTSDIQP